MVAQQSRAKKGKVGNGRKSMSQSIARNNIMAFIGVLTETLTNVLFPGLMAEFHVDTSTVQWLRPAICLR